jgi:hypothetical protein
MLAGQISEFFFTSIGVKQGGPLSPRLFSLYIEEVIALLDESGYGIKIGNMVVKILLYADDIVLFANSKQEMQLMINIVEKFGTGLEIKFNPEKTNFLVINEHLKMSEHLLQNMTLKLNGLPVVKVESVKYLGNIINSALNNTDHINNRIRLAAAAMFKLNECGYDESLDVFTIIQLYKT